MKRCFALPALALALAATGIVYADDSVRDPAAKIVRGYNGGPPCDPQTIGDGSAPKAGPDEDMSNLSVSCSADRNVGWTQLRANLPNPHACVATLGDLRKQRREVTIVRDPTDDNPHHCVLSTITPRQFVRGSRYQP
ncbi:hypothetical protein [Marilutibacter alkalisoli]|uniref:Secreted protein n=1 Tax=Marilutibacter alkalisoli TaxID=2591633 RepID=A0A514BPW9_9GAMM|nr:hypothetical protein [Lysobacter alkalisoli]QDH69079.1 hypothetical protein FKV23_02400 [Lysobacter alkalisoli]